LVKTRRHHRILREGSDKFPLGTGGMEKEAHRGKPCSGCVGAVYRYYRIDGEDKHVTPALETVNRDIKATDGLDRERWLA